MALTKVLVTVMTYTTLSRKHIETVCTAGFREDGSWIRIFPVPHRLLWKYDIMPYSKWQWIEADLERNKKHDNRPESYHIRDINTLKILERIDISGKPNWTLRKSWIFKRKEIFNNMTEMINLTKQNKISLAVLKPSEILDLIIEPVDMQKYRENLASIKAKYEAEQQQTNLFENKTDFDDNFSFAEKIPYKFRYKFRTEDGKVRTIMIEDWELSQLYRKYSNNEQEAISKVKEKYMKIAKERDIYLFMGTYYEWQKKNALDPYLIIGVFYPPKEDASQLSLF